MTPQIMLWRWETCLVCTGSLPVEVLPTCQVCSWALLRLGSAAEVMRNRAEPRGQEKGRRGGGGGLELGPKSAGSQLWALSQESPPAWGQGGSPRTYPTRWQDGGLSSAPGVGTAFLGSLQVVGNVDPEPQGHGEVADEAGPQSCYRTPRPGARGHRGGQTQCRRGQLPPAGP